MDDNKFLRLTMGAVAITWLGISFGVYLVMPGWTERGQFGDMFGAVNALFSGLAFAGLLYTIVLQQKQLSMQRDELGLQRDELRMQREEMAASRGEMESQTNVQRAQLQVAIEQVFVAAAQARIEGVKVSSQGSNDGWKMAAQMSINEEAAGLMKIGNTLQSLVSNINGDKFGVKDPTQGQQTSVHD